jgi:hypothetical protein
LSVQVLNQFDIARWQWPGASVVAATFDDWWAAFQDAVPQLPVSSMEMGETWLTGFASDPYKMAFYRTAAREYTSCVASERCSESDPRVAHFLRMLPTIYDNQNYTNVEFHAARDAGVGTYIQSESSWNEQRIIGTEYAMAALEDHPLAASIATAVQELIPKPPDTSGFAPIPLNSASNVVNVTFPGGVVSLSFDEGSGAITQLAFNGGASFASGTYPLGEFVYQTVNDTDLDAQHTMLDNNTNACCCCYGCVGSAAIRILAIHDDLC